MIKNIEKNISTVSRLINYLTRITIAFLACAILFQLTTNIKLFDMDVIANATTLFNMLGTKVILGILAIIILFYLLRKK